MTTEQAVVTSVRVREQPRRGGRYSRAPLGRSRVYVSMRGSLAYDQYTYTDTKGPEVNKARRSALAAHRGAVLAALRLAGIWAESVSFSAKAGCSCGCSPGWIVKGDWGRDVFVDAQVAWRPEVQR